MPEKDLLYLRLLHRCQGSDLAGRLAALEALRKHDYLNILPSQFLLDRLNATEIPEEQSAILGLMGQIEDALPTKALLAIVTDHEASTLHLRAEVAHTLAVVQAEDAIEVLLRLVQSTNENLDLRRTIADDLEIFETRIPMEAIFSLLNDPDSVLCAAALGALRTFPPDAIPIDQILPYCTHDEWYVREAAIKTLLAASLRTPTEPILTALSDPEERVREAAADGCISLVEWLGSQILLAPLLQALDDEWPSVRENILRALSKDPDRAPVEPIIKALADPIFYVRYAAVGALAFLGKRVPTEAYTALQAMSGADPAPNVRMLATRTLLILNEMPVGPIKIPVFDPTLEELGE